MNSIQTYLSTVFAADNIGSLLTAFIALGTFLVLWGSLRVTNRLLKSNYEVSALSSSIDHITMQTRDKDLIRMFEESRKLRHVTLEADPIVPMTYEAMQTEFKHDGDRFYGDDVLKKVFNYYEATCVGVRKGAFNEDLIRDWWGNTMVEDWIDAQDYIREARDFLKYNELYAECESYVRAWARPDQAARIKD